MSYQVLALKWRPRLFKDAVGQESIAQTLKNSIIKDKIAHAYLLTGTRGIGKTTFARIFAKAIKCENRTPEGEPCLVCDSCQSIDSGQSLDYIEIDGASNNSVDDVRDLIENVQYLPTQGKYKVYIIDEVHMLSVNAFNALLKTLEEPPEHVVFIFATTDPQKLLGTVLSRCMRFDFKNANLEDLESHLKFIAKEEDLTFESDYVPRELAKQSKGSFRDALSLFDQVINLSSGKNITEEALHLSLGMANTNIIGNFLTAILNKDKESVTKIYNEVLQDNIDFKKFSEQTLNALGDVLFAMNNDLGVSDLSLPVDQITKTPVVELMWIYESMYRDLEWSFNTFEAEKATLFAFIKLTMREMLLQQSDAVLSVKKKVESVNAENQSLVSNTITNHKPEVQNFAAKTTETTSQEINEPEQTLSENNEVNQLDPTTEQPRTWGNFLKFLNQTSRGLAVNLEHGNLINKEDFGEVDTVYEIGFGEDSKIFYDYLIELDNSYKLKELICSYLELDISQVEINLKLIENKENQPNFMSNAQITVKNNEEEQDQMKSKILSNKYIKSAEELFNSEVGHVVLNKSEN